MNLDLYTIAAFAVGIMAGAVVGVWLARLIFNHRADALERKVLSLSDNKFELKGQRVSLKQLEQRLDAEAAGIPLAEQELKEKSAEISELTTALNETTALTSELTTALRARKTKVQQLQLEQTKWLRRNKALLMKSAATEETITDLQSSMANGVAGETTSFAENGTASPALVAGHNGANPGSEGSVDNLSSRMQEMESELKNWFDRVGKLEASANGQSSQANGLAMLEEVLRGEASKQSDVASDTSSKFLGNQNGS